jgi:hypothetical protein
MINVAPQIVQSKDKGLDRNKLKTASTCHFDFFSDVDELLNVFFRYEYTFKLLYAPKVAHFYKQLKHFLP